MNKKGMTVVELVVAFSLSTVIALFLIQVVLFLKDTYMINGVKSELVLKQSLISDRINSLIRDNTLTGVSSCGDNCYNLEFSNIDKQILSFDSASRKVVVGDYTTTLPKGSTMGTIHFTTEKLNDDLEYFNIKAQITNSLIKNEVYNINIIMNLNNKLIDRIAPTVTVNTNYVSDTKANIRIEVTDDGGSELSEENEYKYYLSTSSTTQTGGEWKNYTNGSNIEVRGVLGKYYLWIYSVKDNAGNTNNDGNMYIAKELTLSCSGNNIYAYTGNSEYIDDGNGNYRIKLLTTGILTFKCSTEIDAFLVGGGGGGGTGGGSSTPAASGGGGGYTLTLKNSSISSNQSYSITIGAGGNAGSGDGAGSAGDATTAFGKTANPGAGGGGYNSKTGGGTGGSGGGNYGQAGGSYGSSSGGAGQGTTTCEFGEGTLSGCNTGVTAYAGGGGGGIASGSTNGGAGGGGNGGVSSAGSGTANTGGGGGGTANGTNVTAGKGGSGIVIIRNTR